jgi:hypothetical protein
MKRVHVCGFLLVVMIGLGACDNVAPTPTPTPSLPEPPTLAPADSTLPTAPALPSLEVPPTVALPTAALPTAAPPTDLPATEPPTTEPTPETATAEPTLVPPAENQIAPGQRDTATLSEGEFRPYLYSGTQYQPAVLFAEPQGELDVQLLVLSGQLTPESGLDSITPIVSADNALGGRPEIVVLSPETTGLFTFVVRAGSGAGTYTAYLYNLTSPATGMAVQQPDILAAGETKRYDVTSNGGRPVIAMVDPTDLSDVSLDIYLPDGTLLTTANFSGPGGAEVAYVLPMGTTGYTVAVREATGGTSAFNVAVVTME